MLKPLLIVFVTLAVLLSIYLIFYKQIKIFMYGLLKQRVIKSKLKQIAKDHDFLYISQSKIHVNSKKDTGIDNILVTPKFIYAIKNVYWFGILKAKEVDEKWILNEEKQRKRVDNPISLNYLRMKLLSQHCDLPLDRMKNIVLYGDSLKIYDVEKRSNSDAYFISYKDFEKTLFEIEKDEPNYFSDEQQEEIIQKIYSKNKESVTYRKENR